MMPAMNLEFFDSADGEAVVTDRLGRAVRLRIDFLEIVTCELVAGPQATEPRASSPGSCYCRGLASARSRRQTLRGTTRRRSEIPLPHRGSYLQPMNHGLLPEVTARLEFPLTVCFSNDEVEIYETSYDIKIDLEFLDTDLLPADDSVIVTDRQGRRVSLKIGSSR